MVLKSLRHLQRKILITQTKTGNILRVSPKILKKNKSVLVMLLSFSTYPNKYPTCTSDERKAKFSGVMTLKLYLKTYLQNTYEKYS